MGIRYLTQSHEYITVERMHYMHIQLNTSFGPYGKSANVAVFTLYSADMLVDSV